MSISHQEFHDKLTLAFKDSMAAKVVELAQPFINIGYETLSQEAYRSTVTLLRSAELTTCYKFRLMCPMTEIQYILHACLQSKQRSPLVIEYWVELFVKPNSRRVPVPQVTFKTEPRQRNESTTPFEPTPDYFARLSDALIGDIEMMDADYLVKSHEELVVP